MPSLREICSSAPVVVLDASSALVQVGVFQSDGSARWQTSPEESGIAVFQCLERLGILPAQVGSWVYCEGPGSVLGIRTVAMALRIWTNLEQRPIHAYSSLAVVAHALARDNVGVIADARRETWHHYSPGTGLRRVTRAELGGDLIMPEGFRHWSQLPPGVARVPYGLDTLLPRVWDVDLMSLRDAPDAFLHEEPRYVTWTPQVHRAPAP